MELFALILYGIFATLVAPILAFVAFSRTKRLERMIEGLRTEIKFLKQHPVPADPPSVAQPEERPPAALPQPLPAPEIPKPAVEAKTPVEPSKREPARPKAPAQSVQKVAAKPVETESMESRMGGRYLVWLGGLTVLLGGIFLVKYSITEGILSPAVRIALGILFGIALCAVSEWVRVNRPVQVTSKLATGKFTTDQVALSLSFAGVVILYGSVFAARALHDLTGPTTTFLCLTLVSFSALLLSLRQGPVLAVLSLIGAFAVPVLVPSDTPSLLSLNLYLLLVAAGGCVTAWLLREGRLTILSILGLGAWLLIEFSALGRFDTTDLWSSYGILALAALHFRIVGKEPTEPQRAFALIVICCAATFAWLFTLRVGVTYETLPGVIGVCGVLVAIALRYSWAEISVLPAALLSILSFFLWLAPQGDFGRFALGLWDASQADATLVRSSREWERIWLWGGGLALSYAALSIWALKSERPTHFQGSIWAAVAVCVPFFVLVAVHWSMPSALDTSIWGAFFLLLAVGFTGLTTWFAERPDRQSTTALFAVGVLATLVYGAAVALDRTALTTGLCAMLAAVSWVTMRRPIPGSIYGILGLAILIGLRLVFIHVQKDNVLTGQVSTILLLASFGAAALSFHVAARFLQQRVEAQSTDERNITTGLEIGSALLAVLTASFLIRILFTGYGDLSYGLAEQGIQTVLWTGAGTSLLIHGVRHGVWSEKRTGTGMLMAAGLHIMLMQGLLHFPFFHHEPVGQWFGVTALIPAYLLPALAAAVLAAQARRHKLDVVPGTSGTAALALLFIFCTLATRQAFQGPVLHYANPTSDAEWYAYSAVWSVLSFAVLAIGLWRNIAVLRHISLGLILAVVAKTFLWDMSSLTGLYRVASFMGLGLSLIGIGYLYQRVLPRLAAKG